MTKASNITNKQGERLDISFHRGDKLESIVVLGHGVTGDKDRPLLLAVAEGLSKRGWPCIRVSFSGNGDSEGRFEDSTISKEVDDLRTVLKTIPQEKRIAYIGHSMGGAVGVLTASSGLHIQSLISLAGMTHTAEFVSREFGEVKPDEGCMWDEEDCPLSQTFVDDLNRIENTLDTASRVRQPWLLIHGTADDVVPLKDSQDAFASANSSKELLEIPDAGHVFGEDSYPQIVEAIHVWLESSFG
jgi:pimeloyl-ACP methyl ester carboxylesterase|tara:strand:+ start:4973 stop:5704 length:732 start_codon:yes stop_codon:yes gene_type:complete